MTGAGKPPRVCGIVLAAGASSRMGRPKQLLPWKGKPLLAHLLGQWVQTPLDPLILVLGHQADQIQARLAPHLSLARLVCVTNPDWASGLASSLRTGIQALGRQPDPMPDPMPDGALFLLADQPLITARLIRNLIAHTQGDPDRILIPTFEGEPGNPVYFGKHFFPALSALAGDQGGRALFKAHADKIRYLETRSKAVCLDLDRPCDYERLSAALDPKGTP